MGVGGGGGGGEGVLPQTLCRSEWREVGGEGERLGLLTKGN